MNENILNPILTVIATMVGGIISYLTTKQILGDEYKKQNRIRELQKKEEVYIKAITVLTELYAEMPTNKTNSPIVNIPNKNGVEINRMRGLLSVYGTKEVSDLFYDCTFKIVEMKMEGNKTGSNVSGSIDNFIGIAMEDLKETKKDIE